MKPTETKNRDHSHPFVYQSLYTHETRFSTVQMSPLPYIVTLRNIMFTHFGSSDQNLGFFFLSLSSLFFVDTRKSPSRGVMFVNYPEPHLCVGER